MIRVSKNPVLVKEYSDVMNNLAELDASNVKESIISSSRRFCPDDIAIIYFTSGSTGKPKGVKISQQNYITNINNMNKIIKYGAKNVFADIHDTSFVISIPVIFPCLMRKGTLVAPANSIEAGYPANLLDEKNVSCLITVPSLIERLKMQRPSGKFNCSFDCIIVCGEPCHVSTMDFIKTNMKPKSIYNFYGSTEVAPWVFYFDAGNNDGALYESSFIPIGNPISPENIALSAKGELLVTGPQVSPGYLDSDDDEKFFVKDGENWFNMGDVIEQKGDFFYCLGRMDNQVKVNGHRIDLLEIEGNIQSFQSVEAAMCVISKNKFIEYIKAIVFCDKEIDEEHLKSFLTRRIPNYMVPREFIFLREKPLNKNGKLDRAELKKIYGQDTM